MARPERCIQCDYYVMDHPLEYYSYPMCNKNGCELKHVYSEERPEWCPWDEEDEDAN